jgi:hypothetical protein
MSADNAQAAASKESSQSVQLFQRAHQKMVMLQRVEDQMQQLLNQRRSIQDELRGIQVQINEEFDRLLRANAAAAGAAGAGGSAGSAGTTNGRLLVDLADDSKRINSREAETVSLTD